MEPNTLFEATEAALEMIEETVLNPRHHDDAGLSVWPVGPHVGDWRRPWERPISFGPDRGGWCFHRRWMG
jgi:hypothetical protein